MKKKPTQAHTMTTQTDLAQSVLDYVLQEESGESVENKQARENIADALRGDSYIVTETTERDQSRVLFVTSDISVLQAGSAREQFFVALGQWFEEVHVCVVRTRSERPQPIRVEKNVWLYQIVGKNKRQLEQSAEALMDDQLTFGSVFRPDVIVGLDVSQAGMIAQHISRTYSKPLQLHVTSDIFRVHEGGKRLSWSQRRAAKSLLRSAKSVRVASEVLRDMLQRKKILTTTDNAVLPHFYNFAALQNSTPAFDLHTRYSDFKLIFVTFAPLTADSQLHEVFSAIHATLTHNKIGLVVVGDGPARELFEKKANLLDISSKVVFVQTPDDITPYFKTADAILELGTAPQNEETILRAIVSHAPILAYTTELRNDLLEDGESALLCEANTAQCISQKITTFLNNHIVRITMRRALADIAQRRLHEDSDSYYRAYRDTIERALIS